MHRYYDPYTGRYLTPDPIGLEGGLNLFPYVLNNPVNMIDPEGLDAGVISIPVVIGIGIGITIITHPSWEPKWSKRPKPWPNPPTTPDETVNNDTIETVIQPEKPVKCEKQPNHCLVACIRCFAKETRWWVRGPACVYCSVCTLGGGFNTQ